ncbi:RNA polymerase sigma factor [Dyadobacter fanqingshengii]|uniref:RNA polymerase sigma-70 region 2 domain-containing protein n=1 Tax=Dyadobacter fanqingshengii TaxID=2906443 RepID=A0A9X1PH66_9BACT|nr:sigma factor [Dyadobacter fanqingshengii]MCF0043658.1 hypothetical protein [Dyadobacter fanqingshengii]USJ34726.1 hypothetical protein NFI81_18685 [Dyadobacter fanqingshengii]
MHGTVVVITLGHSHSYMRDEFHFTQQQLELGLKANQRAAFEYFYDLHSPALYGIICKIVPDREKASEILQEAFIEFWQKIRLYDAKSGTIFRWALHIARRIAMERAKDKLPVT